MADAKPKKKSPTSPTWKEMLRKWLAGTIPGTGASGVGTAKQLRELQRQERLAAKIPPAQPASSVFLWPSN